MFHGETAASNKYDKIIEYEPVYMLSNSSTGSTWVRNSFRLSVYIETMIKINIKIVDPEMYTIVQ